jgi:DNA mismatch repair protein MutS2
MNNKDLSTLEYDKFKDYLLNKFTSDYAKKHLKQLGPLNNDSEIKEKQSEIKESIYLISIKEFNIPDDSEYTSFILKLDDPLSSYEPRDFLSFMNFHKSLNQLKKELLNTSEILNLKKYLSDIHSFGNLIRNIDSIVDESGRIKDSASEKLTEIRQNIKNNYQIINKKLNNILNKSNSDKFLQEKLITTRNNRFTLMCKSNFRQYIKGIVHDLSDSGQTFFVEPEEIIEINNQYQQYKIKENKEIISIIKKLIREIHQEKELIFITISAYEKLIFCLEIALFYKNYQYCFPELSENLEFNKIHHPLILFFKKDESIPIDINITKENKLAVITGPNTGGKTAALKSIGLNTLIAKSGLPIFGQFAKIHVFNKIFADIGDEQSIQMDLSTFSSHMLNIKRIIENISEDSLVLFDELGTGTEPKEGAFLAISILDYLIKKDVTVIITTHFSEVKHYARQLESATIYSVGFDYDNFKPSYNLIEGVEGKSDPLLIAKKLNFLEEIIKKAEELIAQNTSENELLLEEINDIKLELSNKLTEIDKRLKSIKEKQDRVREKEERLNTMLNKKEIELLEETYMLLNKAKSIIKKKIIKLMKMNYQKILIRLKVNLIN